MYVKREDLAQNVNFAQGSALCVLGVDKDGFDDFKRQYKLSERVDESTRFALVGQDKDTALNAYRLTQKQIPFCLLGARPENLFVNDVLWNGTTPFLARVDMPKFMVATQTNEKQDLEFCARLVFALAEKITIDVLQKGYSETVFPLDFSPDYCLDEQKIYELAKTVWGRVDGLKQAESALTLLKAKEKSKFERNDNIVLLAKYLSNVYKYFVIYQPQSLFPPDNNGREDALSEFFLVENPRVRRILSEYEIRKRYYMLNQNAKLLTTLWENASGIMEKLLAKHKMLVKNNGFCMEEISEDAKFATFIAPDLLDGDTLLSFIKDCGVADNFI